MQARFTMKAAVAILLATGQAAEVTPVQKVIKMLSDMKVKGTDEIKAEEVRFAKFTQWCKGTTKQKSAAIKTAASDIEGLNADIAKAESDIETLGDNIADLANSISSWEADKTAATAQRKEEHEVYQDTFKDLSESVDALERALIVMKKHSGDKAQVLLSKVTTLKRLPAKARYMLNAFIQEDPDFINRSAPEANAYNNQSGGIVSLLEELLGKFTQERNDEQKAEMNAKHGYDMTFEDLVGQIRAAEGDKARKSKTKSATERRLAVAQGDLAKTSAMKAEDTKYLADTDAMCKTKVTEFDARSELRANEVEAIGKAIDILSSKDVLGNAEKHGVNPTKTVSLLQLGNQIQNPAQGKALAFLIKQAHKLESENLAQLTERVAEDPFSKVKKMIWDMVNKLQDQANEEAEHKGWCDKEMKVNKQNRDTFTANSEELDAQREMLEADIAKLAEEIAGLNADVAALDKSRAEATAERTAEKAKNKETIHDCEVAQKAVSAATAVLKEFYEKAGTATAFLEGAEDDAPDTWSAPYQGQQDMAQGGVVGLLEVILSDFARLETETRTAEDQASVEFDDFMADTKKDKAVKNTMITNKSNKKGEQTSALRDTKADLKGVLTQLEKANKYYDRLKPACVHQQVSFAERTKKRQEEVDSLKIALEILSGQQTE